MPDDSPSPDRESTRGSETDSSSPGVATDERVWPVERYLSACRTALADPAEFWAKQARQHITWDRPFTQILDWKPPFARWFPDGTLNASSNCLDRHLATSVRNRVAYYWEGESGERRVVSYDDLSRDVNRLAGALARHGFHAGDFAAIYLPMIPELPVAMLALARLGVTFTTVFSGFSAKALADRIRDTGAPLLFTADAGFRRGKRIPLKSIADEAAQHAGCVRMVVTVRRTPEDVPMTPGHDVFWTDLLNEGRRRHPATAVASDHPLFLLYSSGTTGAPKAIVHTTGGYLTFVAATMRWVFDPKPEDVYWCAADVGWVTGHSYIVFGPLLTGTTSVLYEGAFDYPAADRLWEIVARYGVTILYTSPTALRGLRRSGDEFVTRHDRSSLRLLGTVGEAINPAVWRWYFDVVGEGRCPIVDTWWQTETGGIMVSPSPFWGWVPLKPGSATFPLPGVDADVVDENGRSAPAGTKGYFVIRRPWPGMLRTLYKNDDRYREAYWSKFDGAYYAGDYALKDSDGYVWFLGRADEVLKVAGHRIGTIEIEDALLADPAVAEAAVCGVPDPVKGEVPLAFVVLASGASNSPELSARLVRLVDERIGAIARPAAIHVVQLLPKTRSGKIMRRVVKAVADRSGPVGDVSTLEDGASVDEIRAALSEFQKAVGT